MSKKPRDNRPYLPKVKRIILSEENTRQRLILIVVFLAIAVTAFAYGISAILSPEAGWQVVKASSREVTYHEDFVLQYDFSSAKNPAAVEKSLAAVYTQAQEEAYRIFSPDASQDAKGLAYLNAHPNERVEVVPALYDALELVVNYGDRHVFTAPASGAYNSLFLSTNDTDAAIFDPELDPDTAAWLSQVAEFVRDPSAIWLEVYGDNQVKLSISEAYQAFAREQEITVFLDFGWMRNAFVIDYVADALLSQGFTDCYLVSYDGFSRNLDTRGQSYSQNLFDRQDRDIYMPARLHYQAPMAIVSLRDYPMTEDDRWHYYAYESGRIVTAFLNPGICRSSSSVDSLTAYSADSGCAEILMQTASVFTAEAFDSSALTGKNFDAIWFEGQNLFHTQQDADLELVTDTVVYQKQHIS